MAIKSRHNKKIEPNMSSMSDLVFLLLIFFVITSTLVSPNMISVDLPSSDAAPQEQNANLTVYVDSLQTFHVTPDSPEDQGTTSLDTLGAQLRLAMDQDQSEQHVVILRAHKDVPVQCMVDLMGVIASLNKERETADPPKPKFSMAMATVYPSN